MAACLASGQPFLGIHPPRSLRVLSIDLESPRAAKEQLLEAIPPVDGWDTTNIGITGTAAREVLDASEGDAVIIVDNLQLTRPVNDEQDNAAAMSQIEWFKVRAQAKNAAILLTFNAGKEDEEHPKGERHIHLARGASARVDTADVVLNLVEKGPDNQFTLYVVKSRFGNRGEFVVYKWAGLYDYHVVRHHRPGAGTREWAKAQLQTLALAGPFKRAQAIAAIPNVSARTIDTGLKELVEAGTLSTPIYGTYKSTL